MNKVGGCFKTQFISKRSTVEFRMLEFNGLSYERLKLFSTLSCWQNKIVWFSFYECD
jgi:hypothetical protein